MDFPHTNQITLRDAMRSINAMHPVDADLVLREQGVIAITMQDMIYFDQALHHFCEAFKGVYPPANKPKQEYYDHTGVVADLKTGVSVPGVFGTQFLRIEVSFPSRSVARPIREFDQRNVVGFVMMLIDGGRCDKQSQSFREELNKNLITVGGHLAHDSSEYFSSSLSFNVFGGR